MLEGQDVPKALVAIELRDRTPLPWFAQIETGAMFASTFAVASVASRAFQPVRIRENVEPRCDSNALA